MLAGAMSGRARWVGVVLVATGMLCSSSRVGAQSNGLLVHASDPEGRPYAGLRLRANDAAVSQTEQDGHARLTVPLASPPGQWVALTIASAAAAEDLVWISPWDRLVQVPLGSDDQARAVPLVLGERGSPELLIRVLPLVERIVTLALEQGAIGEPLDGAMARAREDVGLAVDSYGDDLDAAIRAWGLEPGDLYEQGMRAFYDSKAEDASRALAASLAEAQASSDVDMGAVAQRSFFLGHALAAEGRHSEAVVSFARAAAIRDGHPRVLNAWGVALLRADRHAEAERTLRRALAVGEAAVARDELQIASIARNLGRAAQTQGRYRQAQNHYERAVSIGERVLGEWHATVGNWMLDLAGLYLSQRRYDDAQRLYQQSLTIAEAWLGAEHPTVGVRVNGLAGLYHAQGWTVEAGELFRRALDIAEAAYGPGHPTVGIRLNNLALNYQAQQRYEEAEQLFLRALALLEDLVGPPQSHLVGVLQNYGMLLREMGRPEDGAALERRATEARRARP